MPIAEHTFPLGRTAANGLLLFIHGRIRLVAVWRASDLHPPHRSFRL